MSKDAAIAMIQVWLGCINVILPQNEDGGIMKDSAAINMTHNRALKIRTVARLNLFDAVKKWHFFAQSYVHFRMNCFFFIIFNILFFSSTVYARDCMPGGEPTYQEDIIEISDFTCLGDTHCMVSVELPKVVGNAKLVGLTLHKGNNANMKFFVEMPLRTQGVSFTSQVYGNPDYLGELDIRATYTSDSAGCPVYAKKILKKTTTN